jgi:hypothetical protein
MSKVLETKRMRREQGQGISCSDRRKGSIRYNKRKDNEDRGRIRNVMVKGYRLSAKYERRWM